MTWRVNDGPGPGSAGEFWGTPRIPEGRGYRRGMLFVERRAERPACEDCAEGWCDAHERFPFQPHEWPDHAPVAWLPHSCDEWVLGGPDEVRGLIADLQAALKRMGEP